MREQRVGLEHHRGAALAPAAADDVWPPMRTSPSLGVSWPAIIRRIVVLPQPGPQQAAIVPCGTRQVRSVDRRAAEALGHSDELDFADARVERETPDTLGFNAVPGRAAAALDQGDACHRGTVIVTKEIGRGQRAQGIEGRGGDVLGQHPELDGQRVGRADGLRRARRIRRRRG